MITFSELGKLGRLGNQFFQYSALRSLALYHDYDMAIPNPNNTELIYMDFFKAHFILNIVKIKSRKS